ncbi:MAG: thioredoxin domain-containing protein [Arcobacter sp.]|nr:thioredoxin domain-containing protein [Arcobacter sp.]|tara:strand:+ start:32 stop:2059 length:2028 start_codon:yes stop_codon:yes gene_type:complete
MKFKNLILLLFFPIFFLYLNAKETYTNSLINEDSPYLKQHSHNPVNWYAWNEEAFKKAKQENKAIFLSIGYSTCHWCHVMEEESFENIEVANILNKNYISIKIDREEMPHIDKYYQNVHSLINNRSGGWPLTVILTPNKKAFFANTYIPYDARNGSVGIREVLKNINDIFINENEKVVKTAQEIEEVLKEYENQSFKPTSLEKQIVDKYIKQVEDSFDEKYHGFSNRPKFPNASKIETLLDIYAITKNKKALEIATKTLKSMANGGIYDQIEGGFYRYSVDKMWMIPHFEKMLYTNAELLGVYSKAYRITNDIFYKNILDEIISFVDIRFNKQNLFYSASDADSLFDGKKEEGVYFVFVYDEVYEFLEQKGYDENQIENILEYFNIVLEGNFEYNYNNPYLTKKSLENIPINLQQIKKDLKEFREKKKYPFIDYKILTSWNSLYISSLFEAGKINKEYSKKGLKHLNILLENLYINNTLYHQKLIDKKPKVKALLEDYSFIITALLKAYDYSLDSKYLDMAKKLNKEAIVKFYKDKRWKMSDDSFIANADVYDSTYKSSLSNMIDNILKIAALDDDLNLQNIAKESIKSSSSILSSNTSSVSWLLRSYIAYENGYIVLKARKGMFKNKTIPDLPFILKKINRDKKYLACKIGVCFAYGNDFEKIIEDIKKIGFFN